MRYLYIHGANATSHSFNYIRSNLGADDIAVDYDSSMGFAHNLAAMLDVLKGERKLFIVAHSLGGIYALNIADKLPKIILGGVTLSTPYAGSNAAGFASMMMPHSKLLRDIIPSSDAIRSTSSLEIMHSWTQVITTNGNVPWLGYPNDGVVTQSSMRARDDIELIELDVNHYEVVLDPRTVALIRDRSDRVKRTRC